MARIVLVVIFVMVISVGIAWFGRAPAPDPIRPESSSAAQALSSEQTIKALGEGQSDVTDQQRASPAPARRMMQRSDFLGLTAGDRVTFVSSGGSDGPLKHIVAIESVANQSGDTLITGLVEDGGGFIATLGPTLVNVFLQSEQGTLRYAGADFKGELSPLQMANLANDIRLPKQVQAPRLGSSTETPIAQDATQ